jgi:hypothetical protein
MRLAAEQLRKIAADWRSARRIYAIYMEIGHRLELAMTPSPELESPIDRAEPEAMDRITAWMDAAEAQIAPHQLRMHCQMNAISEAALRSLVCRVVTKQTKTEADRDKLDFLMVQYFSQCAPMKVQRDDVRLNEVASVLEIVLGEVDAVPPAWLEPLGKAIDRLRACRSLSELLSDRLLSEGRKMKIGAGERYYAPATLIAFTRYNVIARRTFFRLVRTELDALRADLARLTSRGIATVDCSRAKLSAKESVATLKSMVEAWKQPFRAEYSEGLNFEQLVAIREAVKAAVPADPSPVVAARAMAANAVRAVATAVAPALARAATQPAATAAAKAEAPVRPAQPKPFDVDEEFASLNAQLADSLVHSASAENTMTRLTLGDQRLVLSSWEVRSFIEPNADFAIAMQEGVVTRVLVEREVARAKAGQNGKHMAQVVAFAHRHAATMQEQVAQARDARDIDAAVTLAATSKRLSQLLQEAQTIATERGK